MKKIFSSITVFTLLTTFVPYAFAAPVTFDVDSVCCPGNFTDDAGNSTQGIGYSVYGDDQPRKIGNKCQVQVDLDPVVSAEDISQAGQPGSPSGAGTALESLASPFAALFESLGLKKDLMTLENKVFKGHTEKYHQFLDEEVFGKAITTVSQFQSSTELANFLKEQDGKCNEQNPRPDCVIERAFCSYEKYSGVLFYKSGQQLLDNTVTTQDVQTILAVLQQRDQALFREAVDAQQALDTAIAVYSQFYETYRLHLRFKELIASLVKVRNITSYLHQLVGCIPNKFVGVATTKCN